MVHMCTVTMMILCSVIVKCVLHAGINKKKKHTNKTKTQLKTKKHAACNLCNIYIV